MAKKTAKTDAASVQGAAAQPAITPKKAPASRTRKHVKAQVAGVAAAVESFVEKIAAGASETNTDRESAVVERAEKTEAPSTVVPVDGFVAPISDRNAPAPAVSEIEEPKAVAVGESGTTLAVTHEAIAKLAYQFYLERHGRHGSPFEDWIRAEKTLVAGRAS